MMSYPKEYTTPEDLFVTRDFAKTYLKEGFEDPPTSLSVDTTRDFPETGILTVTSNELIGSEHEEDWACSFSYSSKTETSFEGLDLVKGQLVPKEKGSLVTLNVISDHHNVLVESLQSVQGALGIAESTDLTDISGRLKNLVENAYKPRAAFSVDVYRGFAPLLVHFQNLSTRRPTKWIWNFGDGSSSFSKNPIHTYEKPGIYTIKLSVFNDYGSDEAVSKELICVMDEPPYPPEIEANPTKILMGESASIIASPKDEQAKNRFYRWDWILPEKVEKISSTSGLQSSGLPESTFRTAHPNISLSFQQGGFYDISVIGRNSFGGYNGETKKDLVECVELQNLWDLRYNNGKASVSELGLISKTFKEKETKTLDVESDILDSYDRQFLASNNPFSGIFLRRDPVGQIRMDEYEGFLDFWRSIPTGNLDWESNFCSFAHRDQIYIMFGGGETISTDFAKFNLITRSGWIHSNFGGGELFSGSAGVYSAAEWTGTHSQIYILRRPSFSIFDTFMQYSPDTDTLISVTSPSSPAGSGGGSSGGVDLRTKAGQLVTLNDGIYLFGPVGSVSKYNPSTDVWLIDSNSYRTFESNSRVSAAGKDNLAFVENHGSRYMAYFDTGTSTFISLNTPKGNTLEKEIF